MGNDDIIFLSTYFKKVYNTNDPFLICKILHINVCYKNYHKSFTACTIRVYGMPYITINKNYALKSQKVFCAHELGHCILHNSCKNNYEDSYSTESEIQEQEYEANLFAVSLLFNQKDLNIKISSMDNYLLKSILDYNVKLS